MNHLEGSEVNAIMKGKIVLVVGGSAAGTIGSTVGDAVTEGFCRIGANVAGIDHDLEITDAAEIPGKVQAILQEYGRIDVLVHAWEYYAESPASTMPCTQWKDVVQINLKSKFVFCKEVGKNMLLRQQGTIVLFTSIAGSVAAPGAAAFAASQGAIQQVTRTMGVEWANRGVRVNAIAASLQDGLPVVNRIARDTPIGRLPKPEEIVGTVLYLASDASRMVTGQIISVDGGYAAQ